VSAVNKEINPLLALAIIISFIIPILFIFWITDEQSAAKAGSFFLQTDANGDLSIQVDEKIYHINDQNITQTFDLKPLGVAEFMGNVEYFSNNDILIRIGSSDSGLRAYFSLFSFPDESSERIRQSTMQKDTGGEGQLFRCNLEDYQCKAFTHKDRSIPWRYRVKIDRSTDELYLTEGLHHQLIKFSATGDVISTRSQGLKFPKRVRKYKEQFFLTDTNHHRVEFFSHENKEFGTSINKYDVVPDEQSDAEWPLDALYFGKHWWVINKSNAMQHGTLLRFDEQWQLIDRVDIPSTADLLDMVIYQNSLLISDIASGDILQFDAKGTRLDNFSIAPQTAYFSMLEAKYQYYADLKIYTIITLVILFIGGFAIAIVVGRKHDKENPDAERKLQKQFTALTGENSFMLISNIEVIPNKRVREHLGLVQGSTVRAKHAGKDIMAGIKNLFGGELNSYTDLLQESRDEALQRMSDQAEAIGANAILNVRFSTSSITSGASEILAYGTAVLVEDK
jgi:uncharacterized protein YbjQ (UPF0145 family)